MSGSAGDDRRSFTPTGATLLGMVCNLLAFRHLHHLSLDRDIDRSADSCAAYDASASKWRAFWEVTLPLCRPGIWTGACWCSCFSVGVFLEPKVLGGGKSPMSAELDPPDLRDAGQLAARRSAHHCADGGGGLRHPAVQPASIRCAAMDAASAWDDMGRKRLINAILLARSRRC